MPRDIRDSADPPYRAGAERWDVGPGGLNATCEFFGQALPAPTPLPGGAFRVWTGSSWVDRLAKVWINGEWRQRITRRWTGSAWVPINPAQN